MIRFLLCVSCLVLSTQYSLAGGFGQREGTVTLLNSSGSTKSALLHTYPSQWMLHARPCCDVQALNISGLANRLPAHTAVSFANKGGPQPALLDAFVTKAGQVQFFLLQSYLQDDRLKVGNTYSSSSDNNKVGFAATFHRYDYVNLKCIRESVNTRHHYIITCSIPAQIQQHFQRGHPITVILRKFEGEGAIIRSSKPTLQWPSYRLIPHHLSNIDINTKSATKGNTTKFINSRDALSICTEVNSEYTFHNITDLQRSVKWIQYHLLMGVGMSYYDFHFLIMTFTFFMQKTIFIFT